MACGSVDGTLRRGRRAFNVRGGFPGVLVSFPFDKVTELTPCLPSSNMASASYPMSPSISIGKEGGSKRPGIGVG